MSLSIVVGLGSNLGERMTTLQGAVLALSKLGTVAAVSRLYETRPVGGPAQPDYLNAAVLLRSASEPHALLAKTQAIEQAHGRQRLERFGARTLDIDLLWSSGLVVDTGSLVLPHPRLAERAFALLPLLDVAPSATDPRSGRPYSELVPELDCSGVREVGSGAAWATA